MLTIFCNQVKRIAAWLLLAVAGAGGAWAQSDAIDVVAPAQDAETATAATASAAKLPNAPPQTKERNGGGDVIAKGLASWYGEKFHGRRTASGERYDMHALTAAHKTLPFGSMVRVKSERTGKEVVVRINDRGPYARKRLIDLSGAAAAKLGIRSRGVASVVLLRE